jgi:predicted nucleic acid-binding protein
MNRFVLDCSMTMSWCFEDESSEVADLVLDRLVEDQALVPSIWLLEVANVLLVAERQDRLKPAQTSSFLAMIGTLPIAIDSALSLQTMADAYSLGRKYQLSAYDAAYLELALREGLDLATLDEPLSTAAVKAGINILGKIPNHEL